MEIRTFSIETQQNGVISIPFVVDDDLYNNGYSKSLTTAEGCVLSDTCELFLNSEFSWIQEIPFYYPADAVEFSGSTTLDNAIKTCFPNAKPFNATVAETVYVGDYLWGYTLYDHGIKQSGIRQFSSSTTRRFPIIDSSAGAHQYSDNTSVYINFQCNVIPTTCIMSDGQIDFSSDRLTNGFRELYLMMQHRTDFDYGHINCNVYTISNHEYGDYTLINGYTSKLFDNSGGTDYGETAEALALRRSFMSGLSAGIALYGGNLRRAHSNNIYVKMPSVGISVQSESIHANIYNSIPAISTNTTVNIRTGDLRETLPGISVSVSAEKD